MATENDDQLVERLVPKILSSIRAKAKPVETLPEVQDLTGITSMPCYNTLGEQFRKVLVPINALKQPAVEAGQAADEATAKANMAAEAAHAAADNANGKAEQVTDAVLDLTAEKQAVLEAVSKADESTRLTDEARTGIEEHEARRQADELLRISNEESRVTSENVRTEEFERLRQESERLRQESEAATEAANDTASHPIYVGEDNYVYQWDREAQSYNKTSVYVRGEAFSIKRVYPSIYDMMSDTEDSYKEGDFCLIDTGDVDDPDNAKMYVRSAVGSWDFLVDLSGAIGFTGKVPQLFIGTVSVGSGKSSAAVALTSDGVDGEGNPKYSINYVIPCLAYEDLTVEQIAELQRPATEMIPQLLSTEDMVKDAEKGRAEAEEARVASEEARKTDYDIIRKDVTEATEQAVKAAEKALRYIAQVYEDMPELDTLAEWTDEDGFTHPYCLGDDIYVRDSVEPTGYANYKLSMTAGGIRWIRVAQIPSGWSVVYTQDEDGPIEEIG